MGKSSLYFLPRVINIVYMWCLSVELCWLQMLNTHVPCQRRADNLLQVSYLDWTFSFRMSPSTGPALHNVKFKGQRIAYQISLEEVAVFYSGHAPFAVSILDSSNNHVVCFCLLGL